MLNKALIIALITLNQFLMASSHTVTIEVKKPQKISVVIENQNFEISVPSAKVHTIVIEQKQSQPSL
jgi:hypothetical protein